MSRQMALHRGPAAPFRSFAAVLAAGPLLLVLAGCAGGPGAAGAAGAGPLRDRVTASDESPEARRARVRFELASAYFGRGQLATALDEVKLSIAADPTLGPAFNLRGLIYSSLGDDALAEASFQRAIAINPRDADAMHNLGWHYCRGGRFDEADAQFERALAVPSYRDVTRTTLAQGVCQARGGRLEEAERTLTRAFEVDAGNPAIAVNLAEVLLRRGQAERARYFVQRVNAVPELVSAETLWLGVRIENQIGNRPRVAELGNQLVNRFPQSTEAKRFQAGRFDD